MCEPKRGGLNRLLQCRPPHCRKSECCRATSAAQLSKNYSATSLFACGLLEGWSLGLANFPETTTWSTFLKVLPVTNGRRVAVQMGGILLCFLVFKA